MRRSAHIHEAKICLDDEYREIAKPADLGLIFHRPRDSTDDNEPGYFNNNNN